MTTITVQLSKLVKVFDPEANDHYQTDRPKVEASELLVSGGKLKVVSPEGEELFDIALDKVKRIVLPRVSSKRSGAPRGGETWTDRERAKIRLAFEDGSSIVNIAGEQGRTPGAIKSELKRLGFEMD